MSGSSYSDGQLRDLMHPSLKVGRLYALHSTSVGAGYTSLHRGYVERSRKQRITIQRHSCTTCTPDVRSHGTRIHLDRDHPSVRARRALTAPPELKQGLLQRR